MTAIATEGRKNSILMFPRTLDANPIVPEQLLLKALRIRRMYN